MAWSRASDMAASAPASAVTSANVPTQPAIPPLPSGTAFDVSWTMRGAKSGSRISKRSQNSGWRAAASANVATRVVRPCAPTMASQAIPVAPSGGMPVISDHRGLV